MATTKKGEEIPLEEAEGEASQTASALAWQQIQAKSNPYKNTDGSTIIGMEFESLDFERAREMARINALPEAEKKLKLAALRNIHNKQKFPY